MQSSLENQNIKTHGHTKNREKIRWHGDVGARSCTVYTFSGFTYLGDNPNLCADRYVQHTGNIELFIVRWIDAPHNGWSTTSSPTLFPPFCSEKCVFETFIFAELNQLYQHKSNSQKCAVDILLNQDKIPYFATEFMPHKHCFGNFHCYFRPPPTVVVVSLSLSHVAPWFVCCRFFFVSFFYFFFFCLCSLHLRLFVYHRRWWFVSTLAFA